MSAKVINDGGAAFPFAIDTEKRENIEPGMSLRDYFAGKALPVILKDALGTYDEEDYETAAKASYQIADAMLKARK
jgi:hypothetical protein